MQKSSQNRDGGSPVSFIYVTHSGTFIIITAKLAGCMGGKHCHVLETVIECVRSLSRRKTGIVVRTPSGRRRKTTAADTWPTLPRIEAKRVSSYGGP